MRRRADAQESSKLRRGGQVERLRRDLDRAEREVDRLQKRNKRLENENERLKRDLDAARRAGCRQAAPFAKPRIRDPKRPGRRPGAARLARRLVRPGPLPAVQRFAKHLRTEWTALFTFLCNPAVDAANWRAEQAIRPAVVTRKVCGGNRSWKGAATQQALASVIRTAVQRECNPHDVITGLLRSPVSGVAPDLKADAGQAEDRGHREGPAP